MSRNFRIKRLIIVGALGVFTVLTGCSRIDSTLLSTHMEDNQRAAAKERWDAVRGGVKLQLADEHYKAGRLEDAEKALDEALAMMPNDPAAFLLAAKIRLEQGQLGEARQAITLAVALKPEDAEVQFLAGQISQRREDLPSAFEHYATAAEIAPQTAAYLLAEAEVLVGMDRPFDALELIQPRMIDFDQNISLRMLAARICRIVGLREPAINYCKEAVRISDGDQRLQVELALVLQWAGRFDEVARLLAPVVENAETFSQAPMDTQTDGKSIVRPSAAVILADAYLELSQPESAMAVLRRVMKTCPDEMPAWRSFARAAVAANDLESATNCLEYLASHSAMNAESWLLMAYVSLRRGYPAASRDASFRALQESPDLVSAHFLSAEAAEIEGDIASARAAYEQVLKIDPGFQLAAKRLDMLSMKTEVFQPELPVPCMDGVTGTEP